MTLPLRTKRLLCLWFPDWPLQRRMAADPQLAQRPLLLIEATRRGDVVRYCNRAAQRQGVRAGMPLSEADSGMPPHVARTVEPLVPREDRRMLEALALAWERYSFCIGLEEAEHPECVLLEVTGIAHFHGGEETLVRQLEQELADQHFQVRIALSDSIGSAWAAAHFLARPRRPLLTSASQLPLEALPVEGLRLSAEVIHKLHRLGIRTIRQLQNLERGALPARLGGEPLERLDQFWGVQNEILTVCRPTPRFQVQKLLETGITHWSTMEQLGSLLLQRLLGLLAAKKAGTRRLECELITERRPTHTITVRLCEAAADFRHLGDLLRLKLESLRLESPLVGMRLEALDVSVLEVSQRRCFAATTQDSEGRLATLLNRLSCRLGEQSVLRPQLLPDPTPERAIRWIPATAESAPAPAALPAKFFPLDRPTGLFPQPRPLLVTVAGPRGLPAMFCWQGDQHEWVCHWGPERIETGWWQGAMVRRDYYRVETREGRRLWLFQRVEDERWFWHGEMV